MTVDPADYIKKKDSLSIRSAITLNIKIFLAKPL